MLLAGGGAPFVLIAGSGLRIAGAAEAGALLPGTVPLCVALVSALLGERFGAARFAGIAMIATAVAVVLLPAVLLGADGRWPGYVLLLVAALLSAGYTIALRRSGIGAWEAAAFVSLGSVLMLAPFFLLAPDQGLFSAPLDRVLVQAGFQGLASGVLAPVAFAAAVRRLGPSHAAAFGSLSPGAACFGGFTLLGEVPDGSTLAAVLAAAMGVVLVSRPTSKAQRIEAGVVRAGSRERKAIHPRDARRE